MARIEHPPRRARRAVYLMDHAATFGLHLLIFCALDFLAH